MKKELCVKLVIYEDYAEMHGQQQHKIQPKKFADGTCQHVQPTYMSLEMLCTCCNTSTERILEWVFHCM